MINLKNYVDFLVITKTTQRQFLLLMFLYKKEMKLMKEFKQAFPIDESTMIPKKEIDDLISKGFLIKEDKGYYIGKNFLKVFVTPEVATDEIFELYPKFILNDKGVNIPLTSMDKNLFKNIYVGKINGDYKEHINILKDVEYGIENNLLNMGINKFLVSEFWKVLRSRRQNPNSPQTIEDDNF